MFRKQKLKDATSNNKRSERNQNWFNILSNNGMRGYKNDNSIVKDFKEHTRIKEENKDLKEIINDAKSAKYWKNFTWCIAIETVALVEINNEQSNVKKRNEEKVKKIKLINNKITAKLSTAEKKIKSLEDSIEKMKAKHEKNLQKCYNLNSNLKKKRWNAINWKNALNLVRQITTSKRNS